MNYNIEYIKRLRYPFQAKQFKNTSGICSACGAQTEFKYLPVISDELASQWEVNSQIQEGYSFRESMHCGNCNCSARLRALAKALTLVSGSSSSSLKKSIENGVFENDDIAEINACGELHAILAGIKNLHYSEYTPQSKSIRHEDLQRLSYKDESFDYVLTSDTLEHVPDYVLALKEIHRVLKPKGYHIFTIPLIFSRRTRRRINLEKDKTVQILPASFHGSGEEDNLVTTEFGIDFLNDLKVQGYDTSIYFSNPLNKNEVNYVLVSRKA